MKTKKSQFILEEFWIIGSSVMAVPVKKNLNKVNKFDVEVDFEISGKDNKYFKIVVEVSGNTSKRKVPGYSFYIAAEGNFCFASEKIIEDKKTDRYLLNCGLPMIINNIRSYLGNMTSYGPFGKYSFPLIDVNDLIKKKYPNEKK